MKIIKLAIVALIFLSACGQSPEEKQKQKLSDFLSNFKELEFPVESVEGQIPSDSALTEIDIDLLDIFTDTAGRFVEYGEHPRFDTRYAYVGKISLPEKQFDIIIIWGDKIQKQEGFPASYMLYSISKEGKIIASIPFAYSSYITDNATLLNGVINNKLEIECSYWTALKDFANEFEKGKTIKYKIKDDGTITLTETIVPEKKEVDPEIVLAFLKQFQLEHLPFLLKNVEVADILQLKGFDFLKSTFPFEILYQDFDKSMADGELPQSVLKLYPQENYEAFIVYFWENADIYTLYTMSKTGEIIDDILVMESYGVDGETITTETSFKDNMETKELEFTSIKSHYYNNREENIEIINETINKYKIDNKGKITKLSKDSLHSEYYVYDKIPDNFYLTNNGIGSFKLGQDIHKLEKRLASMTTGVLWTDPNQGEFYAIYNEDLELMFKMHSKTIYQININSKYKTEKGIGVGSSYLDLKTAYPDITAEMDQGEGDPYIVLKIKSMPRFEILIDFYLLEESWELKSDEILSKIPDTAKITKISISDGEFY